MTPAGDIAVLFPGQGSQRVGMGRALAEEFAGARELFERADAALDLELSRIAWEGPEEELTRTENAQPAILVHSYAVWSLLADDLAGRVRYAAGHSLGEFSAYTAAGVLAFDDAVRLVRRRGELMARAPEGGMTAVIGLEDRRVEEICEAVRRDGQGTVVAANFNAPGQVVISGERSAVDAAGARAREAGARMVRALSVSGAFHSPLMEEAEAGLKAALDEVTFGDPEFPVVSNVTAEPVTDGADARALLVRQLTSPVRWAESMRSMIADDRVRLCPELGPGKVLTGLLRRIDPDRTGVAIGQPDDIRSFQERIT